MRKIVGGAVGKWINSTQQPIKNVNKFGLLHYSVPKTLDMVDYSNREFTLQFEFNDGQKKAMTVTLPQLDYYNVTVDSPYKEADSATKDVMHNDQACFTEILQTSINWAIQKQTFDATFSGHPDPLYHTNRLGCVVKVAVGGELEFYFGYRGNVHKITAEELADANSPYHNEAPPAIPEYAAGEEVVKPQTGCPWPASREELVADPDIHGWLRVLAQTDMGPSGLGNRYNWIDTRGIARTSQFFEGPVDRQPFYDRFALKSVLFGHLSPRMQQLIGCEGSTLGPSEIAHDLGVNDVTAAVDMAPTRTVRRGRVCLVDYKYPIYYIPLVEGGSHILKLEAHIRPNMFPPSFLFMDLMTQGTKTKVLGHTAERGGWAIPCSANEFVSGWDNYPWHRGSQQEATVVGYTIDQVRNLPMLMNLGKPLAALRAAKGYDASEGVYYDTLDDLDQTHFDRVPYNAEEAAYTAPGAGGLVYLVEDDYSLVINQAHHAGAELDSQYRFGSRMVHYGTLGGMRAPAEKPPVKSFGRGVYASSPTFTVSMITPTWIYTEVPNSTVQTLDVQLMWGDTSKNITDSAAEPCQFSLIASQ